MTATNDRLSIGRQVAASELVRSVELRAKHGMSPWYLTGVGEVAFSPAPHIEAADRVAADDTGILGEGVAVTLVFGRGSGTSSMGMTALLLDPRDVITVALERR